MPAKKSTKSKTQRSTIAPQDAGYSSTDPFTLSQRHILLAWAGQIAARTGEPLNTAIMASRPDQFTESDIDTLIHAIFRAALTHMTESEFRRSIPKEIAGQFLARLLAVTLRGALGDS